LLHDHTGAKKAYTCDDVRDDLRGTDVTVQVHTDVHEGRSAYGDQRVWSQTATALSVLTFRPDQCAKDEGRDKAHERVEKVTDRERMKECHLEMAVSRSRGGRSGQPPLRSANVIL